MIIMALLIGVIVSISVVLLVLLVQRTLSTSPARRLFPEKNVALPTKKLEREVISAQLAQKLKDWLGLSKDPVKAKELKQKLIRAGHYGERAMTMFIVCKLGAPLILPLIFGPIIWKSGFSPAIKPFLLYGCIALGFYLPNFILNRQIQTRQKQIMEGLPDGLDLLVVCVEAGLGLNAAMQRVADDFRLSNPVLSQEFTMVNLEIMAGLNREQALRNLAERTGVEELANLCAILIQADKFGTSIATALRVQSDTMRTNRRQKLEEKAAQTPVKLIFPLLLCIFPALMVVILGPAIIQVMENFMKK